MGRVIVTKRIAGGDNYGQWGQASKMIRLFVLVTKLRLATHQQRRLLLAESEDAKRELVVPLHY